MKKKSILRSVIGWLIFLALAGALVYFVGIPLYSPQPEEEMGKPTISYYEGGKEHLKMENDELLFDMDPQTTQFMLTEKQTGRVWRSNPENAEKDSLAVSTNKAVLQSTLIVTYSSSSGVIDFNNFQYSIDNGSYTLEQADDGSIQVHYAIGRIQKVFLLPTAITVERFTAFTDAMSKSDSKKVKNVYTLYKPDKVATMSNKDELLAMYPELENQELYVLRSDTSENNKKKIAGYFETAGYTQDDFDLDMQLVAGAADNAGAVFNVTVEYRLDGGDFVVSVPYEKIRYRADYPITAVTVLPMFGAAGPEDNGYMLIPEGGGALIRFNNGKLSQNSYYANMYGWDYGSERTEVVNETKNNFPVFGMIRNDGSFICMIEGASSYSSVQADIGMRNSSFNWINAKYTVIHSDQYNVSAKTSKMVVMYEKSIPNDTIVQRYRFLDSGSYVDMATAYGDYLRSKYPELNREDRSADLPVSVELVGAIDKTVVRFGLPVDSVAPATTFTQAQEIMRDLADEKIGNLSVRMSGWSNGGVNQKVLTSVKAVRELGGEKGLKALIAAAKRGNVPLYFDGISCFAYDSGIAQGFIPFRDAARFTTREQVKISPYSSITYQQQKEMDPFYLVQPSFAEKCADNLVAALRDWGAYGVAFRDVGTLLSSDFNSRKIVTREQVKQMQIDVVRRAREAGEKVIIKEGYDYVMPYADLITDMDLTGVTYSIIDQQIPFYQIALHGAVDYTGKPLNLANDWQTELLRCAEYGAGLNFTFMAEDAKILQDTHYSNYFGTTYASWAKDAADIIRDYQEATRGLNGQRIIGHAELAKGVRVTEYEGGAKVYVNYNDEDFRQGGVNVPARSYLVLGGEKQ